MLRSDRRKFAVLLAVILATGFGVVYYAKALVHLDDVADANSALSFSDREIAGGNSIIINQQAAYEARALIPPSARYRFHTGSRLRNATDLTIEHVASWYRYFLMPRRPTADARWIICYGCDVSALPPTYSIRWQDDNGISIGRLD